MSTTVHTILNNKGRHVIAVSQDLNLLGVACLLRKQKIGAVVIQNDENGVAGIFTERDLARAVAEFGADALDMRVDERMTTNVYCCDESTTVTELEHNMNERRFRHAPVLRNGQLCGIVSIGDVVKSRIHEVEQEAEHMRAYIAS